MDVKNIIKESLQDQYGLVKYLWVTSDEEFYVNPQEGMLTSTDELDYDVLISIGIRDEQRAHQIFTSLRTYKNTYYVKDYDTWQVDPLTDEMYDDLKLVKYFVGAVKDSGSEVFDQLSESDDLDWIKEPQNNPLDGVKFTSPLGRKNKPLTIIDNGGPYVTINDTRQSEYARRSVENFFDRGIWKVVDDTVNESDEWSWADDIKGVINSCKDLAKGGEYTLNGKYCFDYYNTPFTVVDFVELDDGSDRDNYYDYIVADFYEYKDIPGYKFHNAKGLCKEKTCFYLRCDELNNGYKISAK